MTISQALARQVRCVCRFLHLPGFQHPGGEVADPPFYPPVRDFEEQRRGLFFKASYNWRI